jgi:hypothetical protein
MPQTSIAQLKFSSDTLGENRDIACILVKVASLQILLGMSPYITRWFLVRLILDPYNRGDTFLRNVDSCTDYTVLYPSNFHS